MLRVQLNNHKKNQKLLNLRQPVDDSSVLLNNILNYQSQKNTDFNGNYFFLFEPFIIYL